MIDEIFKEMHQEGFSDWGAVLIGLSDVPGFSGRLTNSSIEIFANSQLENLAIDDPILDLVVEISTNANMDSNDLREILNKICEEKKVKLLESGRAWRVFILRNILSEPEDDPMYGMIRISEFWSNWGWPSDAPSIMYDESTSSAETYYTKENYERIIENHHEWINRELMSLLSGREG